MTQLTAMDIFERLFAFSRFTVEHTYAGSGCYGDSCCIWRQSHYAFAVVLVDAGLKQTRILSLPILNCKQRDKTMASHSQTYCLLFKVAGAAAVQLELSTLLEYF